MPPDNRSVTPTPPPSTGWQAVWSRRGPLAWALTPLAALHAGLLGLRRRAYALGWWRSARLPVPVLVVGNVVVGGAGKTPTVIALLAHLRSRGWNPGVVSRGYGRQGDAVLEVRADTPAADGGDEPTLIHQRTGVPVFVARARAQAGLALLAAHPTVDLIVCDDGLQHWALHRDLAVAVFDERGVGNGWLLPAGLLREPWPAPRGRWHTGAARGPDLVLHHQTAGRPARALLVPPDIPCFAATRRLAASAINAAGEQRALHTLASHPLSALAGIAQPEAFFAMLRSQGLVLTQTTALPDHAPPEAYTGRLPPAPGVLLCTEKDAVKLFARVRNDPQARQRVWAVPLELALDPGFLEALDQRLEPLR